MSTEIKYQKINTRDIVINPLSQRDVEARKAQFIKIMREFNPDLVNPIKVAFINNKYYCFDGQMTMKVLKARNKGKDTCVECKVFYGLDDVDMSELFVKQNGVTTPVRFADKVRVMKNFGDPEMVDFVRTTEANGLEIAWNSSKSKNAVNAVNSLYKCYKELIPNQNKPVNQYAEFVTVVKSAWDGDPISLRSELLRGVSLFMKTYCGQYDTQRLIKKLNEKRPMDIIRDAQVDRSSGARKYAVMVLNIYNGSLRNPLPNLL